MDTQLYRDDPTPLMDIIQALRSAKLFWHRIIGNTLSCEVTPNRLNTDLQTNLRIIRYYPCIVHTGSNFIKLMLVIPFQRYILFHYSGQLLTLSADRECKGGKT